MKIKSREIKFKAGIFDLDGTILDSMPVWLNLGADYLKSRNIEPPQNLREILKPMSLAQAAEYFRKKFGITETDSEIIDQVNKMLEHAYFNTVKEKPGIIKFLENLRAAGVKMCIATATDKYLVEAALKRLKLTDYFDFIITSKCVGAGKDSPVIYFEALKKLGAKIHEAIVFEDALHAIETAKKAGFIVAGVYDLSAQEDLEEIKNLCDYFIEDFNQLTLDDLGVYGNSY